MKGLLLFVALCIIGTNAIPKPLYNRDPLPGRIGGGEPHPNALHACMVLVHRRSLDGSGTAALGGGSIVSERHVLTAAHLVQGDNLRYQVGFFAGTNRRMFESTFRIIHEDYNNTNFASDIALIFLQGANTFPAANVIPLSDVETPPATSLATVVVGFGFTAADSTGAATEPYYANQNVAADCSTLNALNVTTADTHFCAQDDAGTTFLCPGDNGCGLFVAAAEGTEDDNLLYGIVSRVRTGCAEAQPTAYTNVGPFYDWVSNITRQSVSTFIANYKRLNKN